MLYIQISYLHQKLEFCAPCSVSSYIHLIILYHIVNIIKHIIQWKIDQPYELMNCSLVWGVIPLCIYVCTAICIGFINKISKSHAE